MERVGSYASSKVRLSMPGRFVQPGQLGDTDLTFQPPSEVDGDCGPVIIKWPLFNSRVRITLPNRAVSCNVQEGTKILVRSAIFESSADNLPEFAKWLGDTTLKIRVPIPHQNARTTAILTCMGTQTEPLGFSIAFEGVTIGRTIHELKNNEAYVTLCVAGREFKREVDNVKREIRWVCVLLK